MPYVKADTSPRTVPIERISDESVYPLIDAEIQRVPDRFGVYVLHDSGGPIWVEHDNLLNGVLMAKSRHPKATGFQLIQRYRDMQSMVDLVEVLRKEYGLSSKQPMGFSRPA